MILVELEIEDYKQFAGSHVFAPSPEGAIAIIGHNGAGKTTLFEAIEWCLYQPRNISADDVAPRGKVAKPRVKLTLMDPASGIRYVVSRSLSKSKVADAEIYREDDADTRIVKGSRQTTDFVSNTLIGLGHRAFVSTFFTRQKELTFFGELKDTERRREIGRLLGMETIRDAQKLIGDERTELQNRAKSLELQYQEATLGRDFGAEIEEAERLVTEHIIAVEAATLALAQAERQHLQTRTELERLTSLERADSTLRTELERIQGDIRAAEARRDAAIAELGRIEEAARERERLEPIASELDSRRSALQEQDIARERFQTRNRLESDVQRAQSTRSDSVAELRKIVSAVLADGLPSWSWSAGDDAAPIATADRLIAVAGSLDISLASTRVEALSRSARLASERDQLDSSLRKMRSLLDRLSADLAGKCEPGDPRQIREQLGKDRERTLKHVHESGTRIKAIDDEIARLEPIQTRLRAQEDGTICPTCGRPIHADDITVTLSVFAERITSLESERTELDRKRPGWLMRVGELETEIAATTERASEIDVLRGRIDSGGQKIADAEGDLALKSTALVNELQQLRLSAPPSAADLEQANQKLEMLRRVAGTGPLLVRIASSLRQAIADETSLTGELKALGPVDYDAAVHDVARTSLSESERAAARIGQIDSLLAQRPERQQEMETAQSEITALLEVRDERVAKLAEFAFDPAFLERAREIEQQAMIAERQSRDLRAKAEAARIDAGRTCEAVVKEQSRVTKLIERSETHARQAGQLDLMYREFNAFEQFVADRLTPQLSDYTSELLSAITEGKYDRVEFNGNYGIEVFDGDDEKFPVEEFSGGERDVIALCARLALSRLIGSQANNPPGFMVMDEIFGSLDRERRTQVLEILGALAGTADAFHQLFIISHVDDVRSSPVFNEIWRVLEGPDGISHLENLNLTGGFDDA